MPFNSLQYVIFFLVVLAVSWALVGLPRARLWFIVLASFYFYTSNSGWLVLILIGVMQIDFFAAKAIEATSNDRHRKTFLVLSMASNLGVLAFFKYCNFFASTISNIAEQFGCELGWVELNILLPIGISFYTFESMSYTIDVYRREIRAEKSWIRYAFFVVYFPHLIAGPILRPREFLPQLHQRARLTIEKFDHGTMLIFRGLLKKIVFGDFLARYADLSFDAPHQIDTIQIWIGVYAFAFQIYFDFSGYTDIARGCAKLMGYEICENFRRPYIAQGFSDFWLRWHISLSSWLKNYLYIPLGGNRMPTKAGVYRNLMITMLLGGLWHGAAWHFVLWGFLHGLFLVAERHFGRVDSGSPVNAGICRNLFRIGLVFHGVLLCWIFFRIGSVADLFFLTERLLTAPTATSLSWGYVLAIAIMLGGWLAQIIDERYDLERRYLDLHSLVKTSVYCLIFHLVVVFGSSEARQFIYFQF